MYFSHNMHETRAKLLIYEIKWTMNIFGDGVVSSGTSVYWDSFPILIRLGYNDITD